MGVFLSALPARAGPATEELRVLTLNAFITPFISPNIEGRKSQIGRRIGALAPDIVTLQEVWSEDDARDVAAALSTEGLRHAHWVAKPGQPPFGSSGLMTLSRYPLSVIAFEPYEAGATPAVLFHVDWTASKGVLQTRAMTPFGPIDIANTHVHAGYSLYDYPAVRLMQLVELADMIERHARVGEPLIVAGDLNSSPGSLPVQFLRETGALEIVSETLDIDLILTRDSDRVRLRPLDTRTVLTEQLTLDDGTIDVLSDHPGVLTVFRVESASAPAKPPSRRGVYFAEAERALRARITETRRLRWFALGAALLSGLAVWTVWRRQRSAPGRGPLRLLVRVTTYAVLAVVLVWGGYLGSLYASAHLRDLDRALVRLGALQRVRGLPQAVGP